MNFRALFTIMIGSAVFFLNGCSFDNGNRSFEGRCLSEIEEPGLVIEGDYGFLVSSIGLGSYYLVSLECEEQDSALPVRADGDTVRNQLESLLATDQCKNYALFRVRVLGEAVEMGGGISVLVKEVSISSEASNMELLRALGFSDIRNVDSSEAKKVLGSC